MTRGNSVLNEIGNGEKKNSTMNGFNRHSGVDVSSAISETFSSLLRRISTEREREQRLQACTDLRRVILEAKDFKALNREPFSILRYFDELLHTRMNLEMKREISKCLGAMGFIMAHKTKDYLVWLFDNYERTTVNETKALYMTALAMTYTQERGGRRRLEDATQKLLLELQKSLENVESPQVLVAILGAIVSIAVAYPESFSPHFKDIVDIIVGWYVDTEQDEAILTKCGDALSKLHTFWLNDMEFTLAMLTHFLEDAETYVEDMRSNTTKKRSDALSANDCFRKTAALVKAFKTILSAISEYFIVTADHRIYCRFVEDAVVKTIFCVEACAGKQIPGYSSLVESALESLKLLLDVCRMSPEMVANPAVTTCCKLVESEDLEETSALAVLALAKKVISNLPADVVAKYVGSFISPNGCIFKLRLHHSQEVARETFAAYKLLLIPRGIKCLQEVYKFVLGEMIACFEAMHTAAAPTESMKLPDSPNEAAWMECEYSPVLAEAVVVYLSNALVELATAKSSVIGMWALSPSLFQLLTCELPVTTVWLGRYFPSAQYSLLSTLKMHCDKHDYFIASSDLLVEGSTGSMLTFAQSAKHFEVILNLLIDIFNRHLTTDITALALRWTKDVIEAAIRSGTSTIFRLPLVQSLILACFDVHSNNCSTVDFVNCVNTVIKEGSRWLPLEIFCKYAGAIANVALETNDKNCLSNLTELPTLAVLNMEFSATSPVRPRGTTSNLTTLAPNFEALSFKVIIDFLLHGTALVDEENAPCPWPDRLAAIYAECTKKTRHADSSMLTPSYLWRWAVWQAACFCVNSRLKTTLGKPQDTFLAIEGELKHLANDATKAAVQSGASGGGNLGKDWFRVRMLLNFIEFLEKLMYNAYEGTAFSLLPAPKPAKAFFRTNKTTCLEWLNRIRVAVMTVAHSNGNYGMVVRLGWTALKEIESNGSKSSAAVCVERVLPILCQALIKLKCSSALAGLDVWSKKYLNAKLSWIKSAADQAAEKYEIASKEYSEYLSITSKSDSTEESKNGDISMSSQTGNGALKFSTEALVDCYLALSDYDSFHQWREMSTADGMEWTNYPKARLMNIQEKLSKGQLEEVMDERKELTTARMTWRFTDCVNYLDTVYHDAAVEEEGGGRKVIIKKAFDELNEFQYLHLCSNWPEELAGEMEIHRQYLRIVTDTPDSTTLLDRIGEDVKGSSFQRLNELRTKLTIRNLESNDKNGTPASELCLPLSYIARKFSNFTCASKMLHEYAGVSTESDFSGYLSSWSSTLDTKKLLVGYHASKLTFLSSSERKTAFSLLCNTVSGFLDGCAASVARFPPQQNNSAVDLLVLALSSQPEMTRRMKISSSIASGHGGNPMAVLGKCLATLAGWLEQDSSFGEVLLAKEDTFFIQLLEHELQLTERIVGVLDADCVVGALLSLSCRFRPGNCKSETVLADWAYKTARKYIDGSGKEEHIKLSEDEVALIEATCQEETKATKDAALALLSTLRADDGEIHSEEELRSELESLSLGLSLSVDSLIPIWQRTNYRVFLLYGVAVDSYLKILHSTDQKPSSSITASLRLLRLLIKHYSDLQHFVSGSFLSVPARAWKDIIPQLFARLNHPSAAVRNVISGTLCQIADSHPDMVAFPAVVGSMTSAGNKRRQNATQDLFTATTQENALDEMNTTNLLDMDIRLDDNFFDDSVMNDAYSVVVDALRSKSAAMVDDIGTFISELQRITLLREEVWLMALSHMEPEVSKRLAQLEEDIQATERHDTLSDADKELIIAEKRDIMSKMIFQTLTDLYEATSAEPQTVNEQQFFDTFCPVISAALTKLVNSQKPEEIWAPFAKMLHTLYSRAKPALSMTDISPVLAAIRSSHIPMPGVSQSDRSILIDSVCMEVTVLPTKTRPKRLRFMGSDGNRYTYLFKGLEDLHLDERMMQFLGVCNHFFDPKKSLEKCVYKARNYSVTPLGNRSGLIQWVEHATPVFSLYKRWQLREASLNPGHNAVNRPSDLFRKKLEPLLRRRNVYDLQNRHKWPPSVLRDVLNELITETPCDLLQKEFWCVSKDADNWWKVTQHFARSTAVMSMIGYLIGLGDRHLDNVLVDLHTGEIVHIDYNVCFEKGVHLRVPERVPFRLTQNLKCALGPTGVEGTFRVSCEETLRFLRRGGESLLTLLEAFVYDPLVDWTTTHETGVANFLGHNVLFTVYGSTRLKKYAELGRQLAYRLFSVRVREISNFWMKNKESMQEALKAYHDQLSGVAMPAVFDTVTVESQRHKALAEHHKTMLEVRGLIKSLAKYEESCRSCNRPFSDYTASYKTFSEALTLFLKPSETSTRPTLNEILAMVSDIYDGLLALAGSPSSTRGGVGIEGNIDGEQRQTIEDIFTDTPKRHGQAVRQRRRDERNIHALNVWRRVKIKLEGREPDPGKRSSVAEQVDYIIRESTSIDNLSLMYEGWTAWV